MNGVAFASGRASPEGAAWLQTCWHWSGVNTAEGRPEVIVFVCASRHVAVNGNTKSEISDALSMGSSIQQFPPPGETTEKGRRVFLAAPLGISKERRRRPRPQLQANHPFKVARSNKGSRPVETSFCAGLNTWRMCWFEHLAKSF